MHRLNINGRYSQILLIFFCVLMSQHIHTIFSVDILFYRLFTCIPLIVNVSPPEIINKIDTHSFQGFSKYIKIKILESYNEECTIQNCYICTEIYDSTYVCYLFSVSYTLTIYKYLHLIRSDTKPTICF